MKMQKVSSFLHNYSCVNDRFEDGRLAMLECVTITHKIGIFSKRMKLDTFAQTIALKL